MTLKEKLLEQKEKKKTHPVAGLAAFAILAVGAYYAQMAWVNNSVSSDFESQYEIAKQGGDKVQICVQAQMVAQAYLQAKDQTNFNKWKAIQSSDCAAAGMPTDMTAMGVADAQAAALAGAGATQTSAPVQTNAQIENPSSQAVQENSGPISPSFDCAKASNQQERMVCNDPELAALDNKLHQAFQAARSSSSNRALVLEEQRAWVKNAFRSCSDKQCLVDAYSSRLWELGVEN